MALPANYQHPGLQFLALKGTSSGSYLALKGVREKERGREGKGWQGKARQGNSAPIQGCRGFLNPWYREHSVETVRPAGKANK